MKKKKQKVVRYCAIPKGGGSVERELGYGFLKGAWIDWGTPGEAESVLADPEKFRIVRITVEEV